MIFRKTEFLDPCRRLVDETVAWLCGDDRYPGCIRMTEGARSLAHELVIVPTAQSGRGLRLALAKEAARRGWGGLLPPLVLQPMSLVRPADGAMRDATDAELRATFLKFVADLSADVRLGEFPHLFQTRTTDGAACDLAADFSTQLAFFDQLADIWRILAGGGMTMADVPRHPEAAELLRRSMGCELERWNELAAFETEFFGRLHTLALRHQSESIRLSRIDPLPVADGIEEVVLPVLADPVAALYDVLLHQRSSLAITVLLHCRPDEADRFDEWGRAKTCAWIGDRRPILDGLRDEDIVCVRTDGDLASSAAGDFPPPADEVIRPSLGLCDDRLFPELAAAFLNRGYVLHNPERHRLSESSLGRMLYNLLDLYESGGPLPWRPFVALLRENDVLSALTDLAGVPDREAVLAGIDVCQNRFLPVTLPAGVAYDANAVDARDRSAFLAFVAAAGALLAILRPAMEEDATPADFLRRAMRSLFARRSLSGGDSEKEFRAAADAVRDVLDAFGGDEVSRLGLSRRAMAGLLRKSLSEAAYSLEPIGRNTVSTEGWLELAWSAADKVALVGLTEGAVPDSVVGHPFVPDDLRGALALATNSRRLARDTMLITDIVRSRSGDPGAVRAYLSLTNADGEQRRPSRLLFLVAPTALASRVRRLFGDLPVGGVHCGLRLEDAWRLDLPLARLPLPNVSDECPLGRLSASAIDTWLRCPLTYLLSYGLGMRHFKEKEELGADDFGSLVHSVLEDYANEQLSRTKSGLDQLTDVRDIASALGRLADARRVDYGERIPLKLRLQLDAVKGRLLAFAPLQAQWAREGWRICERPEFGFNVRPFAGDGDADLPFKGVIDRIDRKEGVGYRLIDYKTWDDKREIRRHVIRGGEAQNVHASLLGLPQLSTVLKNGKTRLSRLVSVQLLLYARCLECCGERFCGQIKDCCYVVLGRDARNVAVFGSSFDQGEFGVGRDCLLDLLGPALDTVRTAIRRIRGNCFWPPGPTDEWKYDFGDLFMISPERDLPPGTPWRDAQEKRLRELGGAQ